MPTEAMQRIGEMKILEATKKTDVEWARILERWGYKKHGPLEATRHLERKYQLASWWAQAIVLRYELHKGVRQVNVFPRLSPELKRFFEKNKVLNIFLVLESKQRRRYLTWYWAAQRRETRDRRAAAIVVKLKRMKT